MKKILFIVIFTVLLSCNARGEENIEFDFDNLEDTVEEKTDLSFNELLKSFIEGENVIEIIKSEIYDILKKSLFGGSFYIKAIIVISIISSIINIAAMDIKDKSVSGLVALIGQIMIIGVSAAAFKNSVELLHSTAQDVTDIVNSAVPFIVMLLSATGNAAAIGGGGIIAAAAAIVGTGINTLVIPLLVISTLLRILNILSGKQLLSKLSELFMSGTRLGLKAGAYIFVFLISFEKLSSGAINKGVGGSFKSLIKMVPVVGDVIGGVSDAALNTIGSITNGVGLIMVVVIIIVSLVPVAQIGITAFMFKLIAAVLEPVCDKQTIEIIDAVGEGNFMILSALFIISAMFVIACAIILCGVF